MHATDRHILPTYDHRPGTGPTLVFLHYWGGSARTWDLVTDRLAGRLTPVAKEIGEVVGFAELEEDGQLGHALRAQGRRGRGVGKRLCRAAGLEALRSGAERPGEPPKKGG